MPVLAAAGFGAYRALGAGGTASARPVAAGPRTGDRIVPWPPGR
ncbi:hypothetical protein [Kitasatospora sp. A2-31]|nr:hypothetical protein [Kitasatospora sp. A2-31]